MINPLVGDATWKGNIMGEEEYREEVVTEPDESVAETEEGGASEEKVETEEQKSEENMIPQSEFDKRFAKFKGIEEELTDKHNLLLNDPDTYYKRYPGERKEPEKPAFSLVEQKPTISSKYDNMIVETDAYGEDFKGLSIAEVTEINPTIGAEMITDLKLDERETRSKELIEHDKIVEENNREISEFSNSLAKKAYGKNVDELAPEEKQNVEAETSGIINFIGERKLGHVSLQEAYLLKNKDTIFAEVRKSGSSDILSAFRKADVTGIDNGKSDSSASGDDFMSMGSKQLNEAVNAMSEDEKIAFYGSANPELKAKHPTHPW